MMTRNQLLDYEIKSSWWAPFVVSFLADPVARYFAWKVKRKYRRYSQVTLEENKRNIQIL